MPKKTTRDYDVCLSFAGEDRPYVADVAATLKERGIRVFYDEYESVSLWGKDLYEHLHSVYSSLARYCVIFISRSYGRKLWTSHERRAAQERAFRDHSEYILPARFDKTQLPGMRETVGYIDLRKHGPEEFAMLIVSKVGVRQRRNYFPPFPDRLFAKMPLNGESDPEIVYARAYGFFSALTRMDRTERMVVFAILLNGCPAELPENVHINLDLLRRMTKIPPSELVRVVGGLSSLGFFSRLRGHGRKRELVKQDFLELKFDLMTEEHGGPAIEIASTMTYEATQGLCQGCSIKRLLDLDFGQLASATYEQDSHSRQSKRRKTKKKA